MPVLNIGGRRVTVDDSFLQLPPEKQNETVAEIMKSLGPVETEAAQPVQERAQATPAAPAPAEERGILSTIDDYVRAAANGMTFGLADRFAAGMGAATGVGGKSGDYAGNLSREQAETERFQKESPVMSTASNVAGGVVVPLGALAAAGRGATLGAKTLLGGGTGAVLGGAQGFGTSKDWTDVPQTLKDTGTGAIGGLVIGGALPGTGRLIGSGYNAISNAVRGNVEGVSRGASKHLVDAIVADGPDAVRARMAQLGDDAMLADAGPAFLGKAQGASLNSDEGRSILQSRLTARNEGTNQRIMGDVNRALGPAEDPQTVTNTIRGYRSDVDGINYPRAFAEAGPVNTSDVLTQLGPMIGNSVGLEQRALTNLRDMLMTHSPNGRVVPQTNAEILHKIKGELDNVIEYDAPGLGLPAAALSRQQGALKHMRGMLNETLERQVPGYMEANRLSAGLARRADAVELGTQYLGSGKTTASPGRFAHEFNQLTPGERVAFAKGSRGNVERVLGTKANDLQALRTELQGEGGWNTAKLATVHGQDAADELMGSVERNLKFRDTHNKVVENSQTEMRRAAREIMKPTPSSETPLVNPNMTATGFALAGLKKGLTKGWDAVKRDPTESYGDLARALSETGRARDVRLQAIVDALERRKRTGQAAPILGDRAALIAAIAASGAHNDRMRRQGPK